MDDKFDQIGKAGVYGGRFLPAGSWVEVSLLVTSKDDATSKKTAKAKSAKAE